MKVLFLGDFSDEVIKKIDSFAVTAVNAQDKNRDYTASEVLLLLLDHKPDVLVVDATPIMAEILKEASFIKMIVCTRGNPINVDSKYCSERGIILTNTPGRNANAVAEFVIGMMINLMRRLPEAIMRLQSGELAVSGSVEESINSGKDRKDITWRHEELSLIPYFEFSGGELSRKNLGLVGFGAVGKLVAEKALALGMKVSAYDPYLRKTPVSGVEFTNLDELAYSSDIISLHAKDTPETEGMIGAAFFAKIKNGAYLVNSARGKLVDRVAFFNALRDNKIAGAALDVFDYEPLCKDDPFLHHPKIICTPHIGGASRDVITQHSLKAFESIKAYAEGKEEIPFRYA
jgi:D-3-phosphoglycerate dehydrogenase